MSIKYHHLLIKLLFLVLAIAVPAITGIPMLSHAYAEMQISGSRFSCFIGFASLMMPTFASTTFSRSRSEF
jgi:hypothetical protein